MLGMQLFDRPDGDLIADFGMATRVEISDAEHGFESLLAFVPMTANEAARWYAMPGAPWVVLSAGWGVAWEGRVEDVAMVDSGLEIGAFGGWRAFSDVPYTALWSKTTTAGWQIVTSNNLIQCAPERYEMDNNNRLFVALRLGESYANLGDVGALTTAAPHAGRKDIIHFSATYDIFLPTNWHFRLSHSNDDFSGATLNHTIIGTGSVLTGTISRTFIASDPRVLIQVINATGATYTMAAATGTYYVRLTDIRIKTTTATTITADLIAADLVDFVHEINSDQVTASTALIEGAADDLYDEIYEDELPADILTALAARTEWETGVWEGRRLHLRPRYSTARTWLVDAKELTMSRTVDTLRNEMYAIYRDANDRLKRTAVAVSATSARDPFVRRGLVNLQTTSLSQAETVRDVRLGNASVVTPRIRFGVEQLYDETGAGPYPLWMARAGDLIVVRNVPPALGTAVDRLRTFRIKRKRYLVHGDRLEITPELELPDLAVMVGNL